MLASKTMSSGLQTLRGRVFFWIGLVVFPVFWVWWMSLRNFTPRQILGGRLWAGVYSVLLLAAWLVFPEVQIRVSDLRWMYSHVAFQVGITLWIWLMFRTTSILKRKMSIVQTIIRFLGFNFILMAAPALTIAVFEVLPPHPASLLFVIVPAVIHLLVNPNRGLSVGPCQRVIPR